MTNVTTLYSEMSQEEIKIIRRDQEYMAGDGGVGLPEEVTFKLTAE